MGSGASKARKQQQQQYQQSQFRTNFGATNLSTAQTQQRSPLRRGQVPNSQNTPNRNRHNLFRGSPANHSAAETGQSEGSTINNSTEMPCASCSSQFTLLSKKVKCDKCEMMFCESCALPIESTGNAQSVSALMCLACFVFRGPILLKSQLVRLRVRDLVRQLRAKGVHNTRGCLTKSELVNLLANIPTVTLLMDDIMEEESSSASSTTTTSATSTTHNSTNNQTCSNGSTSNGPNPSSNSRSNRGRSHSPGPDPYSARASSQQRQQQHNQSNNTSVPNGASDEAQTDPAHKPKERKQLSSIENEEDIEKLPVRELKEILVNNFVVIRGLCEKEELVQKAKMLWRQEIGAKREAAAAKKKNSNSTFDFAEEENICKICMDAPINCVLLECGHMVACVSCGKKLSECPVCRQYVVRAVHTFKT